MIGVIGDPEHSAFAVAALAVRAIEAMKANDELVGLGRRLAEMNAAVGTPAAWAEEPRTVLLIEAIAAREYYDACIERFLGEVTSTAINVGADPDVVFRLIALKTDVLQRGEPD